MSYCLNPGCTNPANSDTALYCQACGSELKLEGRYLPLSLMGQGGFGRTFLAVDESMPEKSACVIKQFHFSAQNPESYHKAAQLFRQEVMRLQVLGQHPQIPQLLAYIEQNQRLYCIQELIPGPTLAKALQQQGVFREDQIWHLLQDLLPVLQFIHDHQVIHRDIKPANIIYRITGPSVRPGSAPVIAHTEGELQAETVISQSQQSPESPAPERGQYVLIDFGIAKFLTGTALVRTGTIIGSPEFMAPEQTRGKALPASDLYGLGVTCLHLLTDVSPWDLYDVVNEQWVWRDFLTDHPVSSPLATILDRLVAGKINERYSSATEALDAIEKAHSTPLAISTPVQSNPATNAIQLSPHPLNWLQKITHFFHDHPLNDDLSSAVGVDYTKLQHLLASHHWQDADTETWEVLCQALGKTHKQYLFSNDITQLPDQDLQTIDRLWVKYSQGRFGFSVQMSIYDQVKGDYGKFCQQVGWLTYNTHDRLQGFNFKLSAPVGHLPSRIWMGGTKWWSHAQAMREKMQHL